MAKPERKKGRFVKSKTKLILQRNLRIRKKRIKEDLVNISNDHFYENASCITWTEKKLPIIAHEVNVEDTEAPEDPLYTPSNGEIRTTPSYGTKIKPDEWKEGRRIVEWLVLVRELRVCKICKLGPLILTESLIVGEMIIGLSGYLYVRCSNTHCGQVNIVRYGKTHREKQTPKGMPCFVVNTKFGAGNNIFSTFIESFCYNFVRTRPVSSWPIGSVV